MRAANPSAADAAPWPRRLGGTPQGGGNPVSDDGGGAGERLCSTRGGGGGWSMGGWRSGGVEWAQQICSGSADLLCSRSAEPTPLLLCSRSAEPTPPPRLRQLPAPSRAPDRPAAWRQTRGGRDRDLSAEPSSDGRSNELTRACPPEIVCHWRLRRLKQGLTRSDPEAIQAILASAPRNILYLLFCPEFELL